MAIYRNIQMTFWTDPKITDDFTPEDKYFYLYLFTNPHTNLCGCYEVSIRQISLETGYSKDTIERLLDRFKNIHKVIDYSGETKEVILINWHKYNWTKSLDFRKALIKEIEIIKNADFKAYLKGLYDGFNTIYTPSLDGVGTTDTVTDTVTDTDYVTDINTNNTNNKSTKRKNSTFTPPTIEEIRDYCYERGNKVDPETFFDFYECKGWMVGKNKMKDWKAAVRTWERNRKETSGSTGSAYMDAIKNRVNVVDDWV